MARARKYRQKHKFIPLYKDIRLPMPSEKDRELATELTEGRIGNEYSTKNSYKNKWIQANGIFISINKMNTLHLFYAMCHCIMYDKYLYALEDIETEWNFRKQHQKRQMAIEERYRIDLAERMSNSNIFTTTNLAI